MPSWYKVMLGAILVLFTLLRGCGTLSPAWACDSNFLQAPGREPDQISEDTFAGFIFATWLFPVEERKLVAVYVVKDILSNEGAYPLFYIVTNKDHTSVVYIDMEGEGHCYDIRRY